ncbi:MAG: polynucleotide adenylyltransferase PcnB [Proteobacteria bacterium]|nr:polynucleotide adenylyltransferase PcnB [Pseudomonadota bacterium]
MSSDRKKLRYLPGDPVVLTRDEHPISRKNIDYFALKVMGRLIKHGYLAFLVGGGVRDLLLGKQPKDFDIGTDATPEEVRDLFRNSRLIGRRFRLAQVYFARDKIFEVSTFRDNFQVSEEEKTELVKDDNTYGDPETDALRRDLTINGLFYDLNSFSVIDYVGGINDLENKTVRIIGDPVVRIKEDPVRMIRAVRHAARTGFKIEKKTFDAIVDLGYLIKQSPPTRVYEELVREIKGGNCNDSLKLLIKTGLVNYLLPDIAFQLRHKNRGYIRRLEKVSKRIDDFIKSGQELECGLIFLALYVDIIQISIPDKVSDLAISKTLDTLSLEKTVDTVFKPLGVTNRERELMVKVLALAWKMVISYVKKSPDKSLTQRKYFMHALLLLDLTASESKMYDCIEYWSEELGRRGKERTRSGKNTRPNRNRRPRRPQADKNTQ